MYPAYRGHLAPTRLERFPLAWVAGENLLYLATWALAGALVWPLRWQGWPLATVAWAAVVVIVQVLLKKHICSGCYYYGKTCHLGWGKLAACLFPRDSGRRDTGVRLAWFYVASPPLFVLVGLLVGALLPVSPSHWATLGAYVALNALSFPVRRRGCGQCAMRAVCPGSAASAP